MTDLPAILRVEHLAELLGLTASGVRKMLRRGEIPSFTVGRQVCVSRAAFEAFQRKGERERAVNVGDCAALLRALPRTRARRAIDV